MSLQKALELLDDIEASLQEAEKSVIFVEHIEAHLRQLYPNDETAKVICKICDKNIDEIYEEARA